MEHAKRSEALLSRAEECDLIAQLATVDGAKKTYLNMADLYRQLAAEEAKLTGTGLPVVKEK